MRLAGAAGLRARGVFRVLTGLCFWGLIWLASCPGDGGLCLSPSGLLGSLAGPAALAENVPLWGFTLLTVVLPIFLFSQHQILGDFQPLPTRTGQRRAVDTSRGLCATVL